MKGTDSAMAKAIPYAVCAIIIVYAASYPALRATDILVLREYCVYGSTQDRKRLFTDYVDIGRGSAFEDGRDKLKPKSSLTGLYGPLSAAELFVRGYSQYPKSWISDGVCQQ